MGLRAHVVTKYEVEYGIGEFNYQAEELRSLIEESGICSVYLSSEDDYYSDWEILAFALKARIEEIEKMSEEDIKEFWSDDDYPGKEYIVSMLKSFYNQANKGDDYVHIHWF